jgi:hypothetical protein
MKIKVTVGLVVNEEKWAEENGGDLEMARRQIKEAARLAASDPFRDGTAGWAGMVESHYADADRVKDTYLIVGPGYWGEGDTMDAAKLEFRKAGGKLSGRYVLYHFGERSMYAGFTLGGSYEYTGEPPTETFWNNGKQDLKFKEK